VTGREQNMGVFVGRKSFRDSSYSFTKLFSSITESTVWGEPMPTRIAWSAMLAMADQHGRVMASVPGFAHRARISVDQARKAIECFLSPDPDSRTPDHEGRRIVVIDGGWRLLNYAKYRALKDEESERARNAERQSRFRAKQTVTVTEERYSNAPTVTVTESNPIAEAEAEEEKNTSGEPISPEMVASAVLDDLGLSGRELRFVLENICRNAIAAGTSADELRASLVTAWREYDQAKPNLKYFSGAQKFFGEGLWRNKAGWPWKDGQQPKSRRYA
jgi:hypothetical protein